MARSYVTQLNVAGPGSSYDLSVDGDIACTTLEVYNGDITNVGDIELDSITKDGSGDISIYDDMDFNANDLVDVNEIRSYSSGYLDLYGDVHVVNGPNGSGDLDVDGTKNCVVEAKDGHTYIFSVIESPEIWFEEKISSNLYNGKKEMLLDNRFIASTVIDESHPLQCIVTPTGGCNGLWVEKKFDRVIIHELNNGQSNTSFDITISAKRLGFEDLRFNEYLYDEDLDIKYKQSKEDMFLEQKPFMLEIDLEKKEVEENRAKIIDEEEEMAVLQEEYKNKIIMKEYDEELEDIKIKIDIIKTKIKNYKNTNKEKRKTIKNKDKNIISITAKHKIK